MRRFADLRVPAALALALLGFVAGCGEDGPTTPAPQEPAIVRTIDDVNYIRGKYFFLQRPAEQLATNSRIEVGSLRVFVDDANGANNQGTRHGTAEVDPTQSPAGGDTLGGHFDGLQELTEYEVSFVYYGDRFPVLVLRDPIPDHHILAVTYDEILPGGARRTVGSAPPLPTDPGAEVEPVRLKLLHAPIVYLKASATDPDYWEADPAIDPLAVTRDYELRSFYDLGKTNIDPRSLRLQVLPYDLAGPDSSYTEGSSTFSYLQILGADLFADNGSGAPLEGPDLVVDQFTNAWFLDTERGLLYFPDLRPFDPRITPRPDARPEEDHFFHSRVGANTDVPGLRGRVLWPPGASGAPGVVGGGTTPAGLESNRNPYDKRVLQVVNDRRYFIRAAFRTELP